MNKPNWLDNVISAPEYEKFGLEFTGMGAENICFWVKGSERKLIKVNQEILELKILKELGHKNFVNLTEDYFNERLKLKEGEYLEQEKIIKQIFGNEHVLNRGIFHKKILISKNNLLNILGEEYSDFLTSIQGGKDCAVEMNIYTQPIAQELKNPDQYNTKDYTIDLITHDNFKKTKNINEGLTKIENFCNINIIPEIEEIIGYDDYCKVFKEITKKIIDYTKQTGLIIDVFGPDNITIFKNEDGDIDYHLLDVILPGAFGFSLNIKDDKNLDLLRHAYTYFYSINKIAEILKVDARIEINDMNYFKNAGIPSGEWPKE